MGTSTRVSIADASLLPSSCTNPNNIPKQGELGIVIRWSSSHANPASRKGGRLSFLLKETLAVENQLFWIISSPFLLFKFIRLGTLSGSDLYEPLIILD